MIACRASFLRRGWAKGDQTAVHICLPDVIRCHPFYETLRRGWRYRKTHWVGGKRFKKHPAGLDGHPVGDIKETPDGYLPRRRTCLVIGALNELHALDPRW